MVKSNIRTSFTSSHMKKVSKLIHKSKASLNERYENLDPAGNAHSFFAPTDAGSVYLNER